MRKRCPSCGKSMTTSDSTGAMGDDESRWRPFCSRRCKMIDLGNWLDEVYRVNRPLGPEDLDDDPTLLAQLMAAAEREAARVDTRAEAEIDS